MSTNNNSNSQTACLTTVVQTSEVPSSNAKRMNWITPEITSLKIEKLTEGVGFGGFGSGFGPNFKDFPLPLLGAS